MRRIIDISGMLGYWPAFRLRFHDADGLLSEMASYRIDSCVAFHSDAHWDLERGNQAIRRVAGQSEGKIKPCYILRPNLGTAELPDGPALLRQLREERPVAVKLFPTLHKYLADRFYCGELFEVLNELALPVLFDPDQRPGYEQLPELARSFSRIKFILLRQPLNESRFTLPLLKKTSNVYFDVSTMLDTGWIDELVGKYGSERLLYGSGMPFYTPAGSLGMVFYARVNDRDKDNILGLNWQNLERSIAWK